MAPDDVEDVVALADRAIGLGYYDAPTVRDYVARGTTRAGTFAYVAREADDRALLGFRFSFPPGRWSAGRGAALHPERWGAPLESAAYFQSCFVDPAHMGRGIGRRLSHRALDDLSRTEARVVVAHSWKESPHGSSRRYLERLGFRSVAECPDYWIDVDYVCPRCGPTCRCTALEMVLTLQDRSDGGSVSP